MSETHDNYPRPPVNTLWFIITLPKTFCTKYKHIFE